MIVLQLFLMFMDLLISKSNLLLNFFEQYVLERKTGTSLSLPNTSNAGPISNPVAPDTETSTAASTSSVVMVRLLVNAFISVEKVPTVFPSLHATCLMIAKSSCVFS